MISLTFEFRTVDEAIVFLGQQTSATPAKAKAAIDKGAASTPPASAEAPVKRGRGRPPKNAAPDAGGPTSAAAIPASAAAPVAAPTNADPAGSAQQAGTAAQPLTPSGEAPAAQPTQADAQAALEAVFEAKGLVVAQGLLKQFGASRLREVKPADYAAFIAAAKEVK